MMSTDSVDYNMFISWQLSKHTVYTNAKYIDDCNFVFVEPSQALSCPWVSLSYVILQKNYKLYQFDHAFHNKVIDFYFLTDQIDF